MTDLRIERLNGTWIVVRSSDNKKVGDFRSQADAYWFIDSQKPNRQRQAGDPDAQNT
jgi:hypothetical protein